MSKFMLSLKWLSVAGLLALLVGVYVLVIRPVQLTWQASAAELSQVMPGDDIPVTATFDATRAVTIAGTPEQIWPWLVQWGYGRAGFYGYDLIENIGSPSGLRSAGKIVPELQHLAAGDRILMNDLAYLTVSDISPNQYMVLTGSANPPTTTSVMTWALYPIDQGHTRLVNRFRFEHTGALPLMALNLFTDFADPIAINKIMLGIQGRVEGNVEPFGYQVAEVAAWLLIFIELIVAMRFIFTWRKWGWAWLFALLVGLALLFALFSPAQVWFKLLPGMVLFWLGIILLVVRLIALPHSITLIKVVHTVVFVLLSGLLAVQLYEVIADRISAVTWIAVTLFVAEGIVLVINSWRCPLTALAEKLGSSHGQITDTLLPKWFADQVFRVYGALFAGALIFLVIRLLG